MKSILTESAPGEVGVQLLISDDVIYTLQDNEIRDIAQQMSQKVAEEVENQLRELATKASSSRLKVVVEPLIIDLERDATFRGYELNVMTEFKAEALD